MCWLKLRFQAGCHLCESGDWPVWTFAQSRLSHCLSTKSEMAICVSFMRVAKAMASLHIGKGLPELSSQYQNLKCWLKWQLWCLLCEKRRLWRVWTFTQVWTFVQARLGRRHSTKISSVSSKNDSCVIILCEQRRLWWDLHQLPQQMCATFGTLYQCFNKCSQCVVIRFLKWKSFYGYLIITMLRHAKFPQFRQSQQKKNRISRPKSRTVSDFLAISCYKSQIAW